VTAARFWTWRARKKLLAAAYAVLSGGLNKPVVCRAVYSEAEVEALENTSKTREAQYNSEIIDSFEHSDERGHRIR
jgi:hypothetical protein